MTTEKITRQVTATIQSLAQKEGAGGPYVTITTPPRTGRKFPDNYNVWDTALVEGFKVGDLVTLTLQQGKSRTDNPQSEWDYYWDVVKVAYATAPAQITPEQYAAPQNIAKPSEYGNHWETAEERKEKNLSIARNVALKAAVDWSTDMRSTPPAVCQVAQIFLDFLLGKRPVHSGEILEPRPVPREPATGAIIAPPEATASQEGQGVASSQVPPTEPRAEALPTTPQKAVGQGQPVQVRGDDPRTVETANRMVEVRRRQLTNASRPKVTLKEAVEEMTRTLLNWRNTKGYRGKLTESEAQEWLREQGV